jgi:hypothetical protein
MWYYAVGGERRGPVQDAEMKDLAARGEISGSTLVWQEGMSGWVALDKSPLSTVVAQGPMPPPLPVKGPQTSMRVTSADARSLRSLYTWFWVLIVAGVPLCLIVIGIFGLIAAIVLQFVLLHRLWTLIQDGRARTTPGKAVGFCFIPFFNFYWWFPAFHGLAQDMNTYCRERNINSPQASEGLALTTCILNCVNIIPYLNILSGIATLVVIILAFNSFTKTAASIIEYKTGAQQ